MSPPSIRAGLLSKGSSGRSHGRVLLHFPQHYLISVPFLGKKELNEETEVKHPNFHHTRNVTCLTCKETS